MGLGRNGRNAYRTSNLPNGGLKTQVLLGIFPYGFLISLSPESSFSLIKGRQNRRYRKADTSASTELSWVEFPLRDPTIAIRILPCKPLTRERNTKMFLACILCFGE